MLKAKLSREVFFAVALMTTSAAFAGGGGLTGGATEVTQMANNVELVSVAADAARQAATSANQYLKQIEQWKVQLQQFEIEARNIARLGNLPSGMLEAVKAYDNYKDLRNSLNKLVGSLSTEQAAYQSRFDEARAFNKPWSSYVEAVGKDLENRNQRAISRLQQEEAIMQQVDADYALARRMQDKVPTTDGIHGAIQLMNEQMNKVIVQNAQMMQLMATSQLRDAREKEARDVAGLEDLRQKQIYLTKMQQEIRQRQLEFGAKAAAMTSSSAK